MSCAGIAAVPGAAAGIGGGNGGGGGLVGLGIAGGGGNGAGLGHGLNLGGGIAAVVGGGGGNIGVGILGVGVGGGAGGAINNSHNMANGSAALNGAAGPFGPYPPAVPMEENAIVPYESHPPAALIFVHPGHYRGEFLVIDLDVALIGAAPGNVADSVVLERESQSTVMFLDGAKNAYVGHMTLKFSPDVTSTVPHHKHYCLEVGENCSPTIDHCIIRSTSVGEWMR